MLEPYQELELSLSQQAWVDRKHVVCCSSGTSALCLAFEALQLPQMSQVLISDFTMVACPRAVVIAGHTPVFVDCGSDLNIDVSKIEERITTHTRAILAVHIYGRECDMIAIHNIAKKHSLLVVEDLAEAHGIIPHPQTDAVCHSYYKNKVVAGEEGGSVAFSQESRAVLARQLRSLGFTDKHDFMHIPRGHNYRLANCLAEKILISLSKFSENTEKRHRIAAEYDERCPVEWRMPPRDVNWVFDLRIPGMSSIQQDRVVRGLNDQGIAARHGFKNMSWQPEFQKKQIDTRFVSYQSALASREVLYLPVYPDVTTVGSIEMAFDIIRSLPTPF